MSKDPSILDGLHSHLARYIKTAQPEDLWILVLWIIHTHLATEVYSTPRLLLDSSVPGSGKTTVLDHCRELCFDPVQAASLSSPALVARLLEHKPRTILIDEADRNLHPKREGVGELLAVLNSGYRKGASRPVLVPDKEQGWIDKEMSTFGPVAMAGNTPDLPDDTRSRCIRVLLLPAAEDEVEDSDWELISDEVDALAEQISVWCDSVREQVRTDRPDKPAGLTGRNRERWYPLLRIAYAAGGHWPERCLQLIAGDMEDQAADKENGLQSRARHITLLQHIYHRWPDGEEFWPSNSLLSVLHSHAPAMWGSASQYGELTLQGMGRTLVNHFNARTSRERTGDRRRGYYRAVFEPAWKSLGIAPSGTARVPVVEPDVSDQQAEPALIPPSGLPASSSTSGSTSIPGHTGQKQDETLPEQHGRSKTTVDAGLLEFVTQFTEAGHHANRSIIAGSFDDCPSSALDAALDRLTASGQITLTDRGYTLAGKE